MTMRVRRVRPDEWNVLRGLRLRALATDPRAFGATHAEESALPDEEWRARAARGAEGDESMLAVAEDGAGGAWLGMIGGRRLAESPGEWELISIWTAPEARGRGVAEALVRFGVAWALASGARRVVLWVISENAAAGRLYARCGFLPEGEATQGRRDPTRSFQKMGLDAPAAGG